MGRATREVRSSFALVLAAGLAGCPAPRTVSGSVFASGATTSTGARALVKAVQGASVTWSCPPSVKGPAPQKLTTDSSGQFKSKDFFTDMPGACELVVTKPGHRELRERFDRLCDESGGRSCGSPHVAIELRSLEPDAAAASSVSASVPLDPPQSTFDGHAVLAIVLPATGAPQVDGRPAPDDDTILQAARAARAKSPQVRAVINADAEVPHGRVIRVVELLKEAHITRISFGVAPEKP